MAPLYDGHDYYKRMFELQEKLRKSEEERIRLEERFNVLMRDSRNRHDVCINRLRMRYIQYLEEQRTRDERNHKLLAALDRVMNKLALISAKKDRLNVLRKQYEAYLLRAYANHRPPGSVTGDSGIASQNEDKYTKKTVATAHSDLASAETRSVSSPRVHQPRAPDQPRSIFASKIRPHDQTVDPLINPPPPAGATFDVDHRQTSVLRGPHIYGSVPNIQYPQMISCNYNGSAPRSLQHIPDIRVSYAEAPVFPMAPSDNTQPHAVPANRFFREQAASGLSAATAQFPAGDTARYTETSRNVHVPRQFDPSNLLQYHDANILLPDPRLRIREYDSSYDDAVARATLVTGKSSTYRAGPDVNVANQIGSLPGYIDHILANSQRSDDEGSARSITSDDLDGLIRRNERLLWENATTAAAADVKTPRRSPTALGMDNVNLDENGKTAILENELDRYISNIRKLHREHGVQSLDELDHEQNTSGDLLNVSLSEDALELSTEEKKGARKERLPQEMNKILALANDLASRTANLKEVARDSAGQNGRVEVSPTEVEDGIKYREIAKNDASEFEGTRKAEERAISPRNEIREDVAIPSAKLQELRGDTEIAKETWNNNLVADSAEPRQRDRQVSGGITSKDNANEGIVTSDYGPRNASNERGEFDQLDVATGQESDIEGLLDAVEELAPWDLASMQKKVRELRLDDSDEDREARKNVQDTVDKVSEEIASESHDLPQFIEQSGVDGQVENAPSPQETLSRSTIEMKQSDTSEISETERQNETHGPIKDVQSVPSEISSQHLADESKITSQPDKELGQPGESDEIKQDNDEMAELRADDQFEGVKDGEYSAERGYVEDPSQQAQQYEQDPNQQYYDPNIPYEAGNEEYEGYADQGYAQERQEYVEYVDGQYEQYPEDPNNQQYQHYPDAQYEQDPNQAYDYSGYNASQGYRDPNQQYDTNQGYENNSDNQAYNYTEQVPYDPNQYDNAYEQEYQEEQRNPDDGTEGRAKEPEPEPEPEPETEHEASQRQADSKSEHESNGDGDKSQQANAINGASQSKKKKDVIKSLLDSDTDTTIERNVSNTESDFDFN
ncbi:uncharacterized protein LOC105198658 isoform X2 [Solenopsis invicta]|nr:uncharacterized protein LOC105198658 isoform X2 [Solenopsis invicta]